MSRPSTNNDRPTEWTSMETSFLPGTEIECVRPVVSRGRFTDVLFDFDGTLSLIREGWPDVMIPMMVEVLHGVGTQESAEMLQGLVRDFVMELNGKQTIYQMMRLVAEVERRGGKARPPLEYKQIYHERLMSKIGSRRAALRDNDVASDEMLVPGSRQLLTALQAKEIRMYLASGTDEHFVREEVELLNLAPFFGDRVYGARDDFQSFSKSMVIQRIVKENAIGGDQLLGFGDGYVEIENIKSAGGTAVAVASDEKNRGGRVDPWKRERLIGVGADLVIADYHEQNRLIDFLFPN